MARRGRSVAFGGSPASYRGARLGLVTGSAVPRNVSVPGASVDRRDTIRSGERHWPYVLQDSAQMPRCVKRYLLPV